MTEESEDECCICLNIITDPVQYICSHRYCRNCIMRWINLGNRSCPLCRENLNNITEVNCILAQVGSERLSPHTSIHIHIDNPVVIIKGETPEMNRSEKIFINKIFGYTVTNIIPYSDNNVTVCFISSNIITFGEKINISSDKFRIKNAFATIRNTGHTFKVTPENRIYTKRDGDIFYKCIKNNF